MSDKEKRYYLSMARKAALLAGNYLRHSSKGRKIQKDLARDIKIAADKQSEKIIMDFLKKKSDFSILSEEKGIVVRHNKKTFWVIDPLDGSLNYLRGIPMCCVSVGLWQDNKPILGVVYDFYRCEMFSGIVRKGAWLNGRPIKTSRTSEKRKAILCTGFPSKGNFSSKTLSATVRNIKNYKKVRYLGTAALSITYVASGRADAYFEKGIMLWDVAGAVPLVLGAGGKVKIRKSSPTDCLDVFTSNGRMT